MNVGTPPAMLPVTPLLFSLYDKFMQNTEKNKVILSPRNPEMECEELLLDFGFALFQMAANTQICLLL